MSIPSTMLLHSMKCSGMLRTIVLPTVLFMSLKHDQQKLQNERN